MPKDFGTAGPRAIYPDACRSLDLAAVSGDSERLFWRLISQADDQGRLEGDAYAMKALLAPRIEKLSPRRVTELLSELEKHCLVRLYARDPFKHLIQLVTWRRWQAGMRRAYPSKWPAPEGWTDFVYGHGDDGFKTYREAAGLDKAARKLPAASAQIAGNLPAASPQPADSRAPAYAVPVPSAGAGAGAVPVEIPPPPAERGRRSDGTAPRQAGSNPRATGDNPRANGTSVRQVRDDQKRGDVALSDDELARLHAERERMLAETPAEVVSAEVERYLADHPTAPRPTVRP